VPPSYVLYHVPCATTFLLPGHPTHALTVHPMAQCSTHSSPATPNGYLQVRWHADLLELRKAYLSFILIKRKRLHFSTLYILDFPTHQHRMDNAFTSAPGSCSLKHHSTGQDAVKPQIPPTICPFIRTVLHQALAIRVKGLGYTRHRCRCPGPQNKPVESTRVYHIRCHERMC
jgi:hypothetical protein